MDKKTNSANAPSRKRGWGKGETGWYAGCAEPQENWSGAHLELETALLSLTPSPISFPLYHAHSSRATCLPLPPLSSFPPRFNSILF
ncbi:hypothetical protein NPIL_688911 [Nephila pilipes]|uniref:Uncharacterized protein n=1 Tax=Nephila pilipes TaxID=299642 RepID=A0A8X6P9X6_NEPPI|nr:hypothetical protein NPIL_688911 [Nephila pilipes]